MFESIFADGRGALRGLLWAGVCSTLLTAPETGTAAEATFPAGAVSAGAGGGLALLRMDDVNDFLLILNQVEFALFSEIKTGAEVTADLRYAVTDQIFLGIEGGYLRGTSEDPTQDRRFLASGYPLALIGGGSTSPDGNVVFRFLGGIGALINGKLEEEGVAEISGTGFLGQIGGEVEIRVVPGIALAAQGIARTAKVSRPENSLLDVDFSGGSIRAMLRGYLGGGGGE